GEKRNPPRQGRGRKKKPSPARREAENPGPHQFLVEAPVKDFELSLPVVANAEEEHSTGGWHGYAPAEAALSPEPELPQGEYSLAEAADPVVLPEIAAGTPGRDVELLAPAGGPESAFAAFHYGADAVYL